MADSDKNIVITPQTSQTSDPTIEFKSGATSGDPITLNVTDDGTTSSLSFEGSAGQLFSISNDLTGTIFAVADGSGIPIIEADADGSVRIAEFGGSIAVGKSTASAQIDIYQASDDADILLTRNDVSQTLRIDQNSVRTTTSTQLSLGTNSQANLIIDTGGNATFSSEVYVSGDQLGFPVVFSANGDGKLYKTGNFAPSLYLTRSRSGDTDTSTNDYLGNIFFSGWRSGVSTEAYAAYISCKALSTVSTRQQGQLEFHTAPDNTTYPALSMSLTSVGMNIVGSLGVGTAPSSTTGEIRATDNVTAYYSSDRRLKENIEPIENAVEKVKAISGVRFDWTEDYIKERGGEDEYFLRKKDVGVIAQEIQEVLPEVVAKREDTTLAVRYEKIVPLLIQAIKEQQVEIDKLKEILNES